MESYLESRMKIRSIQSFTRAKRFNLKFKAHAPKGPSRISYNILETVRGVVLHVDRRLIRGLNDMEISLVHGCFVFRPKCANWSDLGRKWKESVKRPVKTILSSWCIVYSRVPKVITTKSSANSFFCEEEDISIERPEHFDQISLQCIHRVYHDPVRTAGNTSTRYLVPESLHSGEKR